MLHAFAGFVIAYWNIEKLLHILYKQSYQLTFRGEIQAVQSLKGKKPQKMMMVDNRAVKEDKVSKDCENQLVSILVVCAATLAQLRQSDQEKLNIARKAEIRNAHKEFYQKKYMERDHLKQPRRKMGQ